VLSGNLIKYVAIGSEEQPAMLVATVIILCQATIVFHKERHVLGFEVLRRMGFHGVLRQNGDLKKKKQWP